MKIKIRSSAFEENGFIPADYTGDGSDQSPALEITDIPSKTKSLALIVDDPDAVGKTFVHWVLYNLPPKTQRLDENIPLVTTLANEARQGINDFKKIGYGGPQPPSGTHRYFFKLYALDTLLNLGNEEVTKERLLKAISSEKRS